MQAVLLIKKILSLSVHIRRNRQLFFLSDKIIHHIFRDVHDVFHLHAKGIRDLILGILLLIKPVSVISVDRRLKAGKQHGDNHKEHGKSSGGGRYLRRYTDSLFLLPVPYISFLTFFFYNHTV